ncbi:hypothetical protein LASUN_10360 [Lentilactobacillus sunkii]|jgi:restriction endonuclease S subunit|uniref:Uncharacterized protein n=1 Tax=Lentilactobacillus sunkii TaxID=481719 RepID=A0A1E7XEA4_9LACO|nr:hypothetical protein [Lentilactobacillus sunkii]OFA11427.1 hypothetical protein LASUN_10360 [Lentilactobacillus sunkii]
MKSKIILTSALLSLGFGITVAITPANASTWHKGLPRIFRGSWHNRYNLWLVHKNTMTIYQGYSKSIGYYMPYSYNHLMYKRSGYTFKVRAWDKFGKAHSTFTWKYINHNKFILGNGIKVYRSHK